MRPAIVLPLLAVALLLPATAAPAKQPGNAAVGKKLFLQAGVFCGSCHTLKAAGSTGRDGPNLDKAKLSYAAVVAAVSKGSNPSKKWPTGMPGYARNSELSKAAIRDLAVFIVRATHR